MSVLYTLFFDNEQYIHKEANTNITLIVYKKKFCQPNSSGNIDMHTHVQPPGLALINKNTECVFIRRVDELCSGFRLSLCFSHGNLFKGETEIITLIMVSHKAKYVDVAIIDDPLYTECSLICVPPPQGSTGLHYIIGSSLWNQNIRCHKMITWLVNPRIIKNQPH